MGARKTATDSESPKQRIGRTREYEEDQRIASAYKLSLERLNNGTASAQEILYFLKQGSTKERLEREKTEEEIKLLKARTEALADAKDIKELYTNAIAAMHVYSGTATADDEALLG